MQSETTLSELLEGIRAVIAKDIAGRPAPRNKAVADPALWRAIENQQKNSVEGHCWLLGVPRKR